MMPQLNKQDLETILTSQLGYNVVIESFTSQALTQPGENFGSTMLAIDVNITEEKDKNSTQKLSLVAKLVPPSEFLWKVFDPPHTFCKEINCYLLVRQEFIKLQQEKGVPNDKLFDAFPKCYGARTTLSKEIGERADEYAAILLENLKTINYHSRDSRMGLDLKHVQLVLCQLARFHALSTAIKILKPQVFKDVFLKVCKPIKSGFEEAELCENIPKLMHYVKAVPGCDIYVDRLKKACEWGVKIQIDRSLLQPKEPYATLCHTDFWINNMLFYYDQQKENIPLDVKFVDFQGVSFTSPARDLIFFLYTSAEVGIVSKYYDDLIHLYHKNFTDCLKSMGCDTSVFNFQSMLDEIDAFAPSEIEHILFMLTIVCADKSEALELSEVSYESLLKEPNDIYKRKAKEFITDFVNKGWL